MRDPGELYELREDLPELGQPVLIHTLTGFVDAGGATRLAREHLLTALDSRVIAEFDVDELLDYRSRRPSMIFVEDHWEQYEPPKLELHAMRDTEGAQFLLLAGLEPDLRWEAFISAVLDLAEKLSVRLTIGLDAIPMAVPHTRPAGVTAHATRQELIAEHEPWLQRVQVPASVGHLLEYRLGKAGRDAMGFAVHVPHYLAQAEYPVAAAVLLEQAAQASGLALPTAALHETAETVRTDIDRQIEQSDEATSLVRALEEQYDSYQQGRQRNLLATQPGTLPTADELGAELERFLAEQSKPGDTPPV